MLINPTSDLSRATRSELVKALDALPVGDPFRIGIRHELAVRVIKGVQRQQLAKQRAAELRAQLRTSRVSLRKAATSDLTASTDDELSDLAVNDEDADMRVAALMEIGRRHVMGTWSGNQLPRATAGES